MKKYAYNHNPIDFDFQQTIERFFVEEIPLYKFSGVGNSLILKIKKQDMSTWKLIHVISKATDLTEREIGYAGLKDKSASTIQYISIPKTSEWGLKNITTDKIEILEKTYNKSPIKIGDLKGNSFVIKLYGVSANSAKEIDRVSKEMAKDGIPNYFGYQRFGEDNRSYLQGKDIAKSGKRLRGAKEKLLVASYQSHLFNSWLASRVNISANFKKLSYPEPLVKMLSKEPQFFKLFMGDIVMPYPYGKSTLVKDMIESSKLFAKGKISPTGLICGSHSSRSQNDAYHLEEPYDDDQLSSLKGDRRFAWIWPEDISTSYQENTKELTISFYLPKGSYATTFLEEIAQRELHPDIKRFD
jgi:tRNA pseudouridine13 synthase